MRPVFIRKGSQVAMKTTFKIQLNCGIDVKPDDVTIELKRKGGGSAIMTYPALEVSESEVTFRWDDTWHRSPGGRYQGIIRAPGCKPICVAVHLDTCTCTMSGHSSDYFDSSECEGC